jgi:hypothetical protein
MQNIWYFSNDFLKILIDYKNNKQYIHVKDIDVRKLFIENKDKLKDLAWIVDGCC